MIWYSLDDQVAFYEDADEVRDATLRILDKFESVLSAHKNRVSDSGVNGAPTRNVYNGAVFSASFGLEVIDALAPPDSAYDLVFFPG